MNRYFIILTSLLILLFQSCDKSDAPEKDYIEKRISVSFDGDPEKVYPWVSLGVQTENRSTLYVEKNGETSINRDGKFSILRGNFPTTFTEISLSTKTWKPEWIYLDIRYRKQMKKPSVSDELRIRIKGYVNDVQCLDTLHVMRAFQMEEKIDISDYLYELKI